MGGGGAFLTVQMWDLHRGQWDATTTVMRATSKCNTVDVSRTWKDATGVNAVVASGHMDGTVRVRLRLFHVSGCLKLVRTFQTGLGVTVLRSESDVNPRVWACPAA